MENVSLVDVLQDRSKRLPSQIVYTYLGVGDKEVASWTYQYLEKRAISIAREIVNYGKKGDCVVLMISPGLEYVASFFACLYAGRIAVPSYPLSNRRRDSEKLNKLISDCDPVCIVTGDREFDVVTAHLGRPCPVINVDEISCPAESLAWEKIDIGSEDIAFLQYTSGSTGTPKGVMVSHGNLMNNLAVMNDAMGYSEGEIGVSWLPPYHDMGLVGGLLVAIYSGITTVLIDPLGFLQQPYRWLKALSDYKAVVTAAPNFAYQMVIDKVTQDQKKVLDLSNLRVALCGAELVRAETMFDFQESFVQCGLNKGVFFPAYGMAETTLYISGGRQGSIDIKRSDYSKNLITPVTDKQSDDRMSVVSCGVWSSDHEVKIIGAESGNEMDDMQVGEVWVRGPSVAKGYWNKEELSNEIFRATVSDAKGHWLRTGDLGFIHGKNLYISGRIKDLIILRGKNYYPQDLERIATSQGEYFSTDGCAAFSVEDGAQETVVLIIEVNRQGLRKINFEESTNRIRRALNKECGINVHDLVFIKPLTLPRTSSGKIKRFSAREAYLNNQLNEIQRLKTSGSTVEKENKTKSCISVKENKGHNIDSELDNNSCTGNDQKGLSVIINHNRILDRLHNMLTKKVARIANVGVDSISIDADLSDFGFDSIKLAELSHEFNSTFDLIDSEDPLTPDLFFEYSSIKSLASYLVDKYSETLIGFWRDSSVENNTVCNIYNKNPKQEEKTNRKNYSNEQFDEKNNIAIIGMSACFPMAPDVETFWDNLLEGKDCIQEIPKERWNWKELYGDPHIDNNRSNVKWGGFIDGIDQFDPRFFGISPKEAELMDPQQRLLMTYAWKVIEDAGYSAESLSGSNTGVFIATGSTGYSHLIQQADIDIEAYLTTGSVPSMGPNRLSFFLNLHGPSEPVETACSSSLVAIHRAVVAIQRGECLQALVGGVNTLIHPDIHLSFNKAGMLCEDGRCKTFSKNADGYVRGEGVGILFLKPLVKAEEDGDNIYGIIRGSSVNHGGKSNSLTAPNPQAQAELITQAHRNANIDPTSISYIEAHGTGTELGDPVEINGLKQAFQNRYKDNGREWPPELAHCGVGSVKSNIGHLELAAGVAGIIKVLLQMQHKTLVKSLHCDELNPYIKLKNTPFYIVDQVKKWDATKDDNGNSIPLRAGISSFGFGGANAHLVLEEYFENEVVSTNDNISNPHIASLIVLSAKNLSSLKQQAKNLAECIEGVNVDFINLAYTLQVARDAMEHRLAIIALNKESLIEKLMIFSESEDFSELVLDDIRYANIEKHKDTIANLTLHNTSIDEDMAKTIFAWIGKNKISKVAGLWVKGLDINWSEFYRENKPKRIRLPGYVFSNKRYWVHARPKDNIEAANHNRLDLLAYEELWVETPLKSSQESEDKNIICFLSCENKQKLIEAKIKSFSSTTSVLFIARKSHVSQKYVKDNVIVVDERDENSLSEALKIVADEKTIDAIYYLWPMDDESMIKDYWPTISTLKAIKNSKVNIKDFVLAAEIKDFNDVERCYIESWIGFERSLKWVFPELKVYVISQAWLNENQDNLDLLIERIWRETAEKASKTVLYKNNIRYELVQVKKNLPKKLEDTRYKFQDNATILITGGAGKIARQLSEYLATTRSGIKLVLLGRSLPDARLQDHLNKLEQLGAEIKYIQANVSSLEDMERVKEEFFFKYKKLDAIFHCAGVESREIVTEVSEYAFNEVLSPKVNGSENIDRVFSGKDIDVVVYFSSSSAIVGDFSNCCYAIANRFQMSFAQLKNEVSDQTRTIAINWPLWEEGGMGVGDLQSAQLYLKSSGQVALPTNMAMTILEYCLQSDCRQLSVFYGDSGKIEKLFSSEKSSPPNPDSHQAFVFKKNQVTPHSITLARGKGWRPIMKGLSLAECLEMDLKEFASELLHISVDELDSDVNLADFGFDSIGLLDFTKKLNQYFLEGDAAINITPSIFFGHSTIGQIVELFLSDYKMDLEKFYSQGQDTEIRIEESKEEKITRYVEYVETHETRVKASLVSSNKHAASEEDIAIIGMSGRFPKARNIKDFWSILENGENVVSEIPKERFDWRKFYGNDEIDRSQKIASRWLGSIPGVDEFDSEFFELSPTEAEKMDPRQRLLMQEAWNALEDAGYGKTILSQKTTGVFVGVEQGDYQLHTDHAGGITSNHDAILSARLSYFLNLSGPVLAINTACSSGLVATHLACNSLRMGECDTAIVAAANIIYTPEMFAGLSQAGMLSSDGKCRAFDKNADGMVPGEAVIAVVLKKLSEAERDGDAIYATIKASGINYDGKTNGITAPNGVAQENLLKNLYQRYQIPVEDMGYVISHGTGTKLGDPVEINALSKAFNKKNIEPYCALTSTKSNFGHTFAASGLLSLVSLVQSMNNNIIPASLHCETESDYIDWKNSPFYVNKERRPWPEKSDGKKLGAVSAFGMSGTNAHIVLENYEKYQTPENKRDFYLLALSAKTLVSLKERVNSLIEFLEEDGKAMDSMASLSYTLQFGRHHFEYRCAVVIQDREDALVFLKKIECGEKFGQQHQSKLFSGTVSHGAKTQERLQEYMDELVEEYMLPSSHKGGRELQESLFGIADLYCNGYQIDYIEPKQTLPRLHLPGYPFVREKHCMARVRGERPAGTHTIEMSKRIEVSTDFNSYNYARGLELTNISDFNVQQFSCRLDREAFYLKDHVMNQKVILPAVAQLEIAFRALQKSWPSFSLEKLNVEFRNVTWLRPIDVDGVEKLINISLEANEKNEISFRIMDHRVDENSDVIPSVYSRGSIHVDNKKIVQNEILVDIKALQERCSQEIDKDRCYAGLSSVGMEYGPALKGLDLIFVGKKEAISKLILPEIVQEGSCQFTLHPTLLDASLHTIAALVEGNTPEKAMIPFAIERINIFATCNKNMWAWVRGNENFEINQIETHRTKFGEEGGLHKFDIDIVSDDGKVCAQLMGVTCRPLILNGETSIKQEDLLICRPNWAIADKLTPNEDAEYAEHCVMFFGDFIKDSDALYSILSSSQGLSANTKLIDINERIGGDEKGGIAGRYTAVALEVFKEVKNQIEGLLNSSEKTPVLLQVLMDSNQAEILAAVDAILKTSRQENHKLIGQLIRLDSSYPSAENLAAILIESGRLSQYLDMSYEGGRRNVKIWEEISGAAPVSDSNVWRDNGVYIITGGFGGIGKIFAKEIARRTQGAKIVLLGRSAIADEAINILDGENSSLCELVYRQVDVIDGRAVQQVIDEISLGYGEIAGVIHCAGIVRDNFIVKKSHTEFLDVLAPKVDGIENIDNATKAQPLDFFIAFSSFSAVTGNAGQVDYSSANSLMDCYISHRSRLAIGGARKGVSLSIAWPIWQEGGMTVGQAVQNYMSAKLGMTLLSTSNGIKAFYQVLQLAKESEKSSYAVAQGYSGKLLGRLSSTEQYPDIFQRNNHSEEAANKSVGSKPPHGRTGRIRAAVEYLLINILCENLKIPEDRITTKASFEKFGVDSILGLSIIEKIEQYTGELPKTLLFEYNSIDELLEYLMEEHIDSFSTLVEESGIAEVNLSADTFQVSSISKDFDMAKHKLRIDGSSGLNEKFHIIERSEGTKNNPVPSEDNTISEIAVIGLSGRYPQSPTLQDFWDNLKNGKNCIDEIQDRWQNNNGKPFNNKRYGGTIASVERFDHHLFGIDESRVWEFSPELRQFMEVAWMAFEDAGYSQTMLNEIQSSRRMGVGVYVGSMYNQYVMSAPNTDGALLNLNVTEWQIANRVSHFFNLNGPSLAINSACSSSLSAIHLACESLAQGGCVMALAGGINLTLHESKFTVLERAKFLGSGSTSKSFGAGDGYIPGEGVGAILLKPLHLAKQDGDQIHAVIKATTVNHAGGRQAFSAPDPKLQTELISKVIEKSGVSIESISYVESAANGSPLGDSIEIIALKNAFKGLTDKKQYCALGSVKSNLGHLEAASGISQITKVILQMKHKMLVPTINSSPINPNLQIEGSAFYLQRELSEWETSNNRRSLVNSFGAGGAYASAILEEYSARQEDVTYENGKCEKERVFVFSAKTEHSLFSYLQSFEEFVSASLGVRSMNADDGQSNWMSSLAYSLRRRNNNLDYRVAIVATTPYELLCKLLIVLDIRTDSCEAGIFCSVSESVMVTEKPLGMGEIAKRWVEGNEEILDSLSEEKYPLLSLPNYIFDHQRIFPVIGENQFKEKYISLQKEMVNEDLVDLDT